MDNAERTKKVGTIVYMAPEVFNNSNYSTKCDVYSFGITLCEMFTRQKPYASIIRNQLKTNPTEYIDQISRINSPLRPNLTADVPITVCKIIQRYLLFK
jgi:serine/threonine protein kinase